jgi:TetR/AcrR family transcriptional repressor of nem operon
MRYSAQHKQQTRRRILKAAAEQFKSKGPDTVSVADVMAAAGLTHGGFYAHFRSKDDLIAETLQEGRGTSAAKLRAAADRAPGRELEAVLASYLSLEHRAHRERGCVVAALGGEAARWGPQARQALAHRAQLLREAVRAFLPQGLNVYAGYDADYAITACMVGGMILARLEQDPAQAERILAACRKFIVDAVGGGAEGE